jgi:serine/threonine protein kinase
MHAVAEGAGLSSLPTRLEKFGRYYLVDRIATGGMAEVWRAVTHGVEGFRRTFVIKRILSEKAASPTFIRLFCDEARVSALLNHPNIVQVYDFGQVGGSYFLAMEYLLGKDLSSIMRVLRAAKAAVPPAIAAYVAREAAIGLHHAHTLRGATGKSLGIVHRDVTPSNVMLLFAGGVKVLDFGIAKVGQAAGARDGEGGVKGKFGYLSPEQARAAADLDGRADVFALGVTLWEMLAGRRLFAGKDEIETLRNVLGKGVPPPSSLRPDVPAALDAVVLRALERDRDKRYETAEAMALDCDRVLREARCDSQTLRGFLNDLFAEESSSLSSEVGDLPEELFIAAASGPIDVRGATPRNDSVEIELVEASAPQGRARTPAPPFGVLADGADDSFSLPRWRPSRALAWAGAAVVLVLAGALLLPRALRAPSPAPRSTSDPSVESAAAPAVSPPSPLVVPPRTVAAPPPGAAVSPRSPVEGQGAVPAPAVAPGSSAVWDPSEHRARPLRGARRNRLSEDMTINPF